MDTSNTHLPVAAWQRSAKRQATAGRTTVDLEDLKQALRATDPAAVLVSPRILRRLLQAEFDVPYLLVQAPHERCYFFDRQVLFRHVEQDERCGEQGNDLGCFVHVIRDAVLMFVACAVLLVLPHLTFRHSIHASMMGSRGCDRKIPRSQES